MARTVGNHVPGEPAALHADHDRGAVGGKGEAPAGASADAGGQRPPDDGYRPEGALSLREVAGSRWQRIAGVRAPGQAAESAVRVVSVATTGRGAEVARAGLLAVAQSASLTLRRS